MDEHGNGFLVPEMIRRVDEFLMRDERRVDAERILNPPTTDRMSSSGRCYRERWFTMQGFEKKDGGGFSTKPALLRIFRLGHVIEDEVVSLLSGAGYMIKDQQLEVGSGTWLGHIDGVIDMGRDGLPDWCLLEVKSAKASRFELLKELGNYAVWNPGYESQIQAYLHHLKLLASIVIVYNKDTSELYVERVLYDADAAKRLKKENEIVISGGVVPPSRPADAKSQYGQFCKWCDFNQTCWGGAVDVSFDE